MKKILSLTLAALLLVSMIPTAMAAENNWQGGTKVEYTAATNEQYTVTVPATLAPGGSGDVVASGTWGSNRKLTVTADDDVTLTNSINAADQKVLDVTFAGIELTGSNTESVSDTKQVAVANITDAIFGTWSGTFNYNVAMSDVAGGSTTEPSDPDTGDDGEEATTFTFTINGTEYQAEEGWTWAEWIDSDYNTIGMFDDSGLPRVNLGNLLIDDGNGSQEAVGTMAEIVINGTYCIFKSIDPNTVMFHDVHYLSSYGETALQWLIFTSDGEIVYGNDIEFPDGTTYGYYTTQGQWLTNDVLNGEFSEDGYTFSAIYADGTTHTYIYNPTN